MKSGKCLLGIVVAAFAVNAMAGEVDGSAVLGSAIGAAAGTAIGSAAGGKDGAVIGGAIGGAVGAAAGSDGRGGNRQSGVIVGGGMPVGNNVIIVNDRHDRGKHKGHYKNRHKHRYGH